MKAKLIAFLKPRPLTRSEFFRIINFYIILGLLTSLVFSIMPLFPLEHYWCDLISHFRVQYLIVATLCLIVLLAQKKWYFSIGATLCMAINIFVLIEFLPLNFHLIKSSSATIKVPSGFSFSVLTANVFMPNKKRAEIIELIRQKGPDIIVLLETNEKWIKPLGDLKKDYPFSTYNPRIDCFGIVLLSRFPISETEFKELGPKQTPSLITKISHQEHSFLVLGVHPMSPGREINYKLRNAGLASIAKYVQAQSLPTIVTGDLNTTPWSYTYRKFIATSGLSNAALGKGIYTSWPSRVGLFSIPLDHLLYKGPLNVQNLRYFNLPGSDHRAFIANLEINY